MNNNWQDNIESPAMKYFREGPQEEFELRVQRYASMISKELFNPRKFGSTYVDQDAGIDSPYHQHLDRNTILQSRFLKTIGIYNYPLASVYDYICQWTYNDIIDESSSLDCPKELSHYLVHEPRNVAEHIKQHIQAYLHALGDLSSYYSKTELFEKIFVKYFLEYIY